MEKIKYHILEYQIYSFLINLEKKCNFQEIRRKSFTLHI